MHSPFDSSVTVVIFNASLRQWTMFEEEQSQSKRNVYACYISFESAWYATLRLISTMATGWSNSKIVLVALCGTHCCLIWETSGTTQELFSVQSVTKALLAFLKKVNHQDARDPLMTLALSKACCIIYTRARRNPQDLKTNQFTQVSSTQSSQVRQRIIIVDIGISRYVDQYIDLANIGLVAQEQKICIDVCDIGPSAVAMLKQLVDLTHGIYLNFSFSVSEQIKEDQIKGTSTLLKYFGQETGKKEEALGRMFVSFMLFHYSVPPEARKLLPTSHTKAEVCSAVCRCHHQPIDIGLVCSCCLAIFCYEYKDPICAVCRVRFKKEKKITVATARIASTPSVSVQCSPKTSDLPASQSMEQ